jgi:hypothetical protein
LKINFKIVSLIVTQSLKIASKDAIFRRKKSCWTGDSLYSSPKVVPDSYLTLANTVRENLLMLKRNVVMKSGAAMVKRLIDEHCDQLEQLSQNFST